MKEKIEDTKGIINSRKLKKDVPRDHVEFSINF
jgi:hypothetical protein